MKLRIGIIGAGFTTEHYHLPAWLQIDGCSVDAVCDTNEDRLITMQDKFGISRTYTDYKNMLSDGGLDIVTVATPAYCHYEQILDSLNGGMHVLTEKPMAVTYEQCLDAINASQRNGRKFMCLQQSRFKNSTLRLMDAVERGELGKIYYVRATSVRSRGVPAPEHFRCDKLLGGGPLYDIGPHIIDIAWLLMGRPRMESVTARCWNDLAFSNTVSVGGKVVNADNYHTEDMVAAQIKFIDGSVLAVEISYLANMPFEKKSECLIWGTDGGAQWPAAEIYSNDGDTVKTKVLDVRGQEPLGTGMFRSFIRSIEKDEAVAIDPLDSAEVIRIVQAIHAAC